MAPALDARGAEPPAPSGPLVGVLGQAGDAARLAPARCAGGGPTRPCPWGDRRSLNQLDPPGAAGSRHQPSTPTTDPSAQLAFTDVVGGRPEQAWGATAERTTASSQEVLGGTGEGGQRWSYRRWTWWAGWASSWREPTPTCWGSWGWGCAGADERRGRWGLGAMLGERSAERVNQSNGSRPRRLDTGVGTLELAIQLRSGARCWPSTHDAWRWRAAL